ncbi:MAG: hypothetical protein PXZ08_04215 [Actinomycetota bacterium]|nr:hypothetical protein [Actinomycetota bacterium]
MFALLWRRAILGALRRSWAQRSGVWLALAGALVLLRRLDSRARRRQQHRP